MIEFFEDIRWPDLLRKYEKMLDLRRAREALEQRGILALEGEAKRQRREAQRRLARQFPGVLRELEILNSEAIESRLADIRSAMTGESSEGCLWWARVVQDYHGIWREALSLKAWLRKRRTDESAERRLEEVRTWLDRLHERWSKPEELDEGWLLDYVKPKDGKLGRVLWARIEQRNGLNPGCAEGLFFEGPAGVGKFVKEQPVPEATDG